MFSYSIQLIPAYLGGIFLAQIDRVMISSYIDNYSTGLYSYAYTLASIQSLLATVFYNAWIPDYFSHMNNQEYEKHDKGALSLLKILTLIACSLILFGDYIGKFLAPREFHDGLSLLPLIVLGIYFSTVTPIFQRNITFSKRTIWTSIIIIFSGLLNVFLNAIYLPKYGIIASASTTLVSYLIQFILTYLVVKYVIKLHYTKLFRVLYLFFPVIICGIVTYFSFDMIFLHSFIIRSITLIGCAIFLYGGIFYQLFNQSGN